MDSFVTHSFSLDLGLMKRLDGWIPLDDVIDVEDPYNNGPLLSPGYGWFMCIKKVETKVTKILHKIISNQSPYQLLYTRVLTAN